MKEKALLKGASYEGKNMFTLPPNSSITKKSYNISVEEIENGFVIRKSYDIEYQNEMGEKNYGYFTKKWYSKKNPMKIDDMEEKETPLEDKL